MARIIGRKNEINELNYYRDSDKSEFVAIYGRRRVGKTFLVNEVFRDQLSFTHTGLSPYDERKRVSKSEQIEHFYHSLTQQGLSETSCPSDWLHAFYMLEQLLTEKDDGSKQIIFIDELPWMDTPGAGFLTALEAFWNGWAASRNVYLIVCGSATSWMLDNLINNKGGLYGRLSAEIHLSPFNLSETEQFFQSRDIILSRYDIIQAYMVLGGIPFYLDKFRKGFSLAQNIDKIMFSRHARLSGEFERLFGSLFSNPEQYMKVVKFLSSRHCGYSRDEISKHTGIKSGSGLTKVLKVLQASEFIAKYKPFDASRAEILYRLIDPFCSSYLHFMKSDNNDEEFWQHSQNLQPVISWRGFAFEEVCMMHVKQIKAALGVAGVLSTESPWTLRGDENHDGSQIDLIISRNDHVVNMCEMKFSINPFEITKSYDATLRNRVDTISSMLKKGIDRLHVTFITTFGVKRGMYSGIVQNDITMDDLFVG